MIDQVYHAPDLPVFQIRVDRQGGLLFRNATRNIKIAEHMVPMRSLLYGLLGSNETRIVDADVNVFGPEVVTEAVPVSALDKDGEQVPDGLSAFQARYGPHEWMR